MNDYNVDPIIWFTEREVEYPPKHFITATTPLTFESKQWVIDNFRGRFSITQNNMAFLFDNNNIGLISFEDPKEATMYELKFS